MRQGKCWSIIVALLIPLVFAHSDEADNIFTIEGIETYHNADNLENAKTFANHKATIEGFGKLIDKLIPASDQNKIYKISNKYIINSVKKITPTKERMTNHSYMATVKVHFDPQKVKNMLNYYGIRYRMEFSDKILFIPIFYEDKELLRNDWQYKWLNLDERYKLLKIGVFTDNLGTELENKLACLFKPYTEFEKIAEEYNAKDLIIVFAEINKKQIEFTIRILNPSQDKIKYLIVHKNDDELDISFLNRAINDLLDKIDEEWKGVKSFTQNIIFTSKVKIKIKTPKVWSAIKQKLDKITAVKSYHITASSLNQIEVELNYRLPTPSFRKLLLEYGIFLMKENEQWVLSLNKT